MRELTYEEMEQIDGGVLPLFPIAVAVGTGAAIGYRNGGIQGAVVAGTLAAPAALFGGIAASSYGAARVMFSAYSFATTFFANEASRNVGQGGNS